MKPEPISGSLDPDEKKTTQLGGGEGGGEKEESIGRRKEC